jgi:catechol 2,3-dioxygenase-like lactoylglutathione lyase family enzyme
MPVVRIVPNLMVTDVAHANALYARLFGLQIAMDLGWVGNLSLGDAGHIQLQTMTVDAAASCNPVVSVGMASPADVDDIYERVRAERLDIVHPLSDEVWGVRRFFFRDPDGNVINVVANA